MNQVMEYAAVVLPALFAFCAGIMFCAWRMSRDPNIVTLKSGQIVIASSHYEDLRALLAIDTKPNKLKHDAAGTIPRSRVASTATGRRETPPEDDYGDDE